jgi:hypothetical protein
VDRDKVLEREKKISTYVRRLIPRKVTMTKESASWSERENRPETAGTKKQGKTRIGLLPKFIRILLRTFAGPHSSIAFTKFLEP